MKLKLVVGKSINTHAYLRMLMETISLISLGSAMAASRLSAKLASAPLPLRWISACVKHGQHDNDVAFDGKVRGIGKAPEQRPADTLTEVLGTSADPRRSGHRWRATRRGTPTPILIVRSRTSGRLPRYQDRLAVPKPVGTRSPALLAETFKDIVCRPSPGGVTAIVSEPLLCQLDVALRHWELARTLCNTVPERL